jgi:hypothetical protein
LIFFFGCLFGGVVWSVCVFQTQAANATNAKVIKIKKEVEQAQDNLIQAQQSVATLEKKIT